MAIFFTKMKSRLSKSKWCKVYIALAVIHMVASVAILVPNLINALQIGDATKDLPKVENEEYPPKYFKVIMESSAFILLETWRLWLALDSILQMNSLTIYASASFAFFSFGFSLSMIVESVRWLGAIVGATDKVLKLQKVNLYIQISLCCVEFVLLIPTVYTAYKVIKDFGWLVYKKLGSSIELQKMYNKAQWFSLLLKIDVFFEVTFIFIVLFTKYYMYSTETLFNDPTMYVYTALAACLTLSLPLAREAISRENYWLINIFLFIQFFYLVFTVHYTYQSVVSENVVKDWYAFYIYLFSVYFAVITTIVLTIMVEINFNKGLKKHVQWRRKNSAKDLENSNSLGKNHTLYKKMQDDPIDDED